jgi:hypothetical protein
MGDESLRLASMWASMWASVCRVCRVCRRLPRPDLHEAFSRDGAFVLSGVLDRERLAALREALRPLITNAPLGTNSFDGFRTRRVFDPLARTRALDGLVLSPVVQRAIQAGYGRQTAIPWRWDPLSPPRRPRDWLAAPRQAADAS